MSLSGNKLQAKFFDIYYGHPARELKLICVTGSTGKSTVARLTHEILTAAGLKSAVLASDSAIKTRQLHRFLSDAWKAGNTYAIVTAPATSLSSNVFYGLPITVAALTDFVPSSLSALTPEEYLTSKASLFAMQPETVILNRDDANYPEFSKFTGTKQTLTYGHDGDCSLVITNSQLYKKGTEASLTYGRKDFTVASFLTGERGSGGLGGLLKALKLEDLDSGDLLLLLIVLLLLWEGDDLELVIALGLVLILGLGDGKENDGDAVI